MGSPSDTRKQTVRKANSIRKQEHLQIALAEDVGFKGVSSGLENYRFIHRALPELDLAKIDLSKDLLGKKLSAPLLISSMVGGIGPAEIINRNLAQAAQAVGVAMAVGSLRSAIDDPSTISTYRVRDVAPDILLLANLGAVQLNYGYGVDECRRAVESIGADALVLHLNPLQEALQPGGNTDFSGLLRKIEQVCRQSSFPVVVKEVGCGISGEAARMLADAGVAAIDVAGAGGTSWSEIERHRLPTPSGNNIAAAFAGWGIPTAECVGMAHKTVPGMTLIASGGIRTGIDVAKVIALGADIAGIAAPLLKAASISADEAANLLREIIEELRIAMFCTGTPDLQSLKGSPALERLKGS